MSENLKAKKSNTATTFRWDVGLECSLGEGQATPGCSRLVGASTEKRMEIYFQATWPWPRESKVILFMEEIVEKEVHIKMTLNPSKCP